MSTGIASKVRLYYYSIRQWSSAERAYHTRDEADGAARFLLAAIGTQKGHLLTAGSHHRTSTTSWVRCSLPSYTHPAADVHSNILTKATTRSSTPTGSRSPQPRPSTSPSNAPASAMLVLKDPLGATPQGLRAVDVVDATQSSPGVTRVRFILEERGMRNPHQIRTRV